MPVLWTTFPRSLGFSGLEIAFVTFFVVLQTSINTVFRITQYGNEDMSNWKRNKNETCLLSRSVHSEGLRHIRSCVCVCMWWRDMWDGLARFTPEQAWHAGASSHIFSFYVCVSTHLCGFSWRPEWWGIGKLDVALYTSVLSLWYMAK